MTKRKRATSSVQRMVRRAAARTLLRLKHETALRPVGPICIEEWKCCRDIIAEEITKLLPPNDPSSATPPGRTHN